MPLADPSVPWLSSCLLPVTYTYCRSKLEIARLTTWRQQAVDWNERDINRIILAPQVPPCCAVVCSASQEMKEPTNIRSEITGAEWSFPDVLRLCCFTRRRGVFCSYGLENSSSTADLTISQAETLGEVRDILSIALRGAQFGLTEGFGYGERLCTTETGSFLHDCSISTNAIIFWIQLNDLQSPIKGIHHTTISSNLTLISPGPDKPGLAMKNSLMPCV